MNRQRIAMIAPSLEILGGQAVQAQRLLKGLRQDGCEVTFIPINPRFPLGLRWIRRYPYVRTLINQMLYLPSLYRMLHADLAHIFSASYWSFLLGPVPAIVMARTLRKRIILNYRSGEAEDHLARWGRLVHPWLRMVDMIVVPSPYLQRVFSGHGYSARMIRNIVDTTRFRYRRRVPLGRQLLSVRNLEPYYRVDVIIEAFALLKTQYPDATLTVAGIGGEAGRLENLAASLGVNGIRFVGRVEPHAMPDLYDESDIFVNASVVDNQPVSVLEALAAGLPVVSTATGDIATMLCDGEAGLIIPPRDPAAIAKAVVNLWEDPDLASRLASRGKEEVERYTWAQVCREWASVYAGGGR